MHSAQRVLTGAITAAAIFTAASAPEVASGADVIREAEHMKLQPVPTRVVRWPKVIGGRTASGGRALHFGRKGSAATTVNAQEISAVTLRARGTSCSGAPVAAVTINGVRIGTLQVTTGKWADYRLPVSRPAGRYRIVVAFINDRYAGRCDRDLYLDRVTISIPDANAAEATVLGNVIWAGDAEDTVASEWSTANAFDIDGGTGTYTSDPRWSGSTRVQRVSSPVAQGTRAYAITVRGGDRDPYTRGAQRSEVGQNNSSRPMPDGIDRQMYQGQDRWIGLQLQMAADYPMSAWNSLVQLKGEGEGNGPLGIYLVDGHLTLRKSSRQSYGSTDLSTAWSSPSPVPRGLWVKLLLHVKWSTGSDGAYELFGDVADGKGFRQLRGLTYGWTLKRARTGTEVSVGARFGIYRSGLSRDGTAYFDGFNVAATRAAATLKAFGQIL